MTPLYLIAAIYFMGKSMEQTQAGPGWFWFTASLICVAMVVVG